MTARRPRQSVGDARKRYPIPLRLRSRFIPRDMGGSEGWRGSGWVKAREKVLKRDKFRSTVSGFNAEQGQGLQVDHIHPFRLGGSNRMSNLRVTDRFSNPKTDFMAGAGEKKPQRDRRW